MLLKHCGEVIFAFCRHTYRIKLKRYDMDSGYHAMLNKRHGVSYTCIYKLGNVLKPVGKIYPNDICLVAETKQKQKLVVTPRGEVGWVHEE